MSKPAEVWLGPVRTPIRRGVPKKKPKQTVDFVLVYKTTLAEEAYLKMETFLFNLEQKGFKLECVESEIHSEVNFIKIFAPHHVLLRFASIFGIELDYKNVGFKIFKPEPYNFMANELTKPNIYGTVYPRARETLSGTTASTITSGEKSLIIYKVLLRNSFGTHKNEYSIERLIDQDVLLAAYPLHDGPYEWTEEGALNDRQLLTRYWSNWKNWYKQQPLDIIEKYFGSQFGFYFAWVGFYNKMLIFAGITGILFFTCGFFFGETYLARTNEVCRSRLYLCPRCLDSHCKFEPLSAVCFNAKLMFLFDNPMVITFAALMSIWSTVFLELWRRKEAMLQIRWNLRSVEDDCSTRPEFEENTTHFRFSTITGTMEPYMPKAQICFRYAITSSLIVLMVLMVVMVIFAVMLYVKTVSVILSKKQDEVHIPINLVASVSGAVMSVAFIILFELLYQCIAQWLTELENPRTQTEFDNSYTYKSYALAFVNNYSVIFYIAFFKARFYTYPGDTELFTNLGGIRSDLCDPSGCIMELGMQIAITLLGKKMFSTVMQYFVPKIMIFLHEFQLRKKGEKTKSSLQWECDFMLNPVMKYHIMDEYMQMIIQYGFVTFFVAAFPPAPFFALINNLIELRVDATKMTKAYQRPVAFKVPNVAAWNGILHGVTYIGVATNAFVIAFTSDVVQRGLYRLRYGEGLSGYMKSILSVYNISEFSTTFVNQGNFTECYYPGKRYPPDHELKYQLTHDFWFCLTIKFLAVVVFEHVVMFLTGIIAYTIPNIPFSVKEHINYHKNQIKAVKLRELRSEYLGEDQKSDIFKDL